jgi:hypothetical protein
MWIRPPQLFKVAFNRDAVFGDERGIAVVGGCRTTGQDKNADVQVVVRMSTLHVRSKQEPIGTMRDAPSESKMGGSRSSGVKTVGEASGRRVG